MTKYRISHEHDGFLIEKELISYDYIFTMGVASANKEV